jgi:hypothetical protein
MTSFFTSLVYEHVLPYVSTNDANMHDGVGVSNAVKSSRVPFLGYLVYVRYSTHRKACDAKKYKGDGGAVLVPKYALCHMVYHGKHIDAYRGQYQQGGSLLFNTMPMF